MVKKIISYLNPFLIRPYPFWDIKRRWQDAFLSSIFVFIIFVLFDPFNERFSAINQFLHASIFAGISFIVCVILVIISPAVFKNYFNDTRWTVLHEIIADLTLLFSIGSAIYALDFIFTLGDDLPAFWKMQMNVMVVGIPVIFIMVILDSNRLLKKNLAEAEKISRQLKTENQKSSIKEDAAVTFTAENGKDNLELPKNEVVVINSADNYVTIYKKSNGRIEKVLFRTSMKNIEKSTDNIPELFRCHRTSIVNLCHVRTVIGSSQGYRLVLNHVDFQVPVARSKTKEFREFMSKIYS